MEPWETLVEKQPLLPVHLSAKHALLNYPCNRHKLTLSLGCRTYSLLLCFLSGSTENHLTWVICYQQTALFHSSNKIKWWGNIIFTVQLYMTLVPRSGICQGFCSSKSSLTRALVYIPLQRHYYVKSWLCHGIPSSKWWWANFSPFFTRIHFHGNRDAALAFCWTALLLNDTYI